MNMLIQAVVWLLVIGLLLSWVAPALSNRKASSGQQLMSLRQLCVSLLLRGIAIGAILALYFTGGVWPRTKTVPPEVDLQVLVDVSDSVVDPRRGANLQTYLDSVNQRVQEWTAKSPVNFNIRYRLFGGLQQNVELPDFLQRLGEMETQTVNREDRAQGRLLSAASAGTQLLDPLQPQSSLFTPVIDQLPVTENQQLAMIFTDGRSTRDAWPEQEDAKQALLAAQRQNIPLLVMPAGTQDHWWSEQQPLPRLSSFKVRNGSRAGSTAMLGVSVQARNRDRLTVGQLGLATGRLEKTVPGDWSCGLERSQQAGRVVLSPQTFGGPNTQAKDTLAKPQGADCGLVRFPVPGEKGFQQISVWLAKKSSNDQLENTIDIRSQFIGTAPKAKALLVDGSFDGSPLLIRNLFKSKDWLLDEVDASRLSTSFDFMQYDLVVFHDVGPTQVSRNSENRTVILKNLRDYVYAGGGLVLAGGRETYGHQGYAGTPVAKILPVDLDPKGSSGEQPMMVTVILDVSASMFYNSAAINRAQDYILDSLKPLSEGSYIRVLGYSDEAHELIPLQQYAGQEDVKLKLRDALDNLATVFEARVQRFLAPEGLHAYRALNEAYKTFDNIDAKQERMPKRIMLVADSGDVDEYGMSHWWVDGDGGFHRRTAMELVRSWTAKGVVLNAIGVVGGGKELDDMRKLWEQIKSTDFENQPADRDLQRKIRRLVRSQSGMLQLGKLAQAGGGGAYLDQFEIPLGNISRPMSDITATPITASNDAGHAFFIDFLKDKKPVKIQVARHAIVPHRQRAEPAMFLDEFQLEGLDDDLALWSSWISYRPPSVDDKNNIVGSAYGGRVISFLASLRDVTASPDAMADFYQSWRRAVNWARRAQARDRFAIEVAKTGFAYGLDEGEGQLGLLLRAQIDSLDSVSWREVRVKLLRSQRGGTTPAVGPATTDKTEWVSLSRDVNQPKWWRAHLPLKANMTEVTLQLEAKGIRHNGMPVQLADQAEVYPGTLQHLEEPLDFFASVNRPWLRQLAQVSGGVMLDELTDEQLDEAGWPKRIVLDTAMREVSDDIRLIWVYALLFALALLADLLFRTSVGRSR